MANIKYTKWVEFGSPTAGYFSAEMTTDMEASGDTKAVYLDGNGGDKIILKGSNFAYLDGDLLTGTVDRIVFQDGDGHTTATVSGMDLKAKQLDDLLTGDDVNLTSFFAKIFGGKDTFTGTDKAESLFSGGGNDIIKAGGGHDFLSGEGGNDRMTGGAGSDTFYFTLETGGRGKDVITDFDAIGGGKHQDYIGTVYEDVVSIKQHGDDVVINFGGGDTMTLLDTDKSDIGKSDFILGL